MQLKLEFQSYKVLLNIPVCDSEGPLARAFCGGYASMTVPGLFDALFDEKGLEAELPLGGWRHLLRAVQRSYDFYVERQKLTDGPLTFVVDGVEYTDVNAIPMRGDFIHEVGTFNLSQPELIAIDPCYVNVMKDAVILGAQPGVWRVWTLMRDDGFNGYSTACLATAHEAASTDVFHREGYEVKSVGAAGVDSGQCGFFDRSRYPVSENAHEHAPGTFYHDCCEATECRADFHENTRLLPADIIPGDAGVNSRTFHGDGGYPCYVRKDAQGKVVTACLVFDYSDPTFGEAEEETDED
jgi:hypothetical protein